MGGTVRFITPEPDLHKYSTYARAEGSSTDGGEASYEMGAAAGGPIVDGSLAFRASAFYQTSAGTSIACRSIRSTVTQKDINAIDTTVLRAAVKWAPPDGLTITPAIYYQKKTRDNDDYFWLDRSNPGDERFQQRLHGTQRRRAILLPCPSLKVRLADARVWNSFRIPRSSIARCIARRTTRSFSGPPWWATAVPIPTPVLPNYRANSLFNVRQNSFTQEMRLQSTQSDSALQWVVGGSVPKFATVCGSIRGGSPCCRTCRWPPMACPSKMPLARDWWAASTAMPSISGRRTSRPPCSVRRTTRLPRIGKGPWACAWRATPWTIIATKTVPLTASATYIQEHGSAPTTTPVTPKIGVVLRRRCA